MESFTVAIMTWLIVADVTDDHGNLPFVVDKSHTFLVHDLSLNIIYPWIFYMSNTASVTGTSYLLRASEFNPSV